MEKQKKVFTHKGKTISYWRDVLEITQPQLAEEINREAGTSLSDVVVCTWESGKHYPSKVYEIQLGRAIDRLCERKGIKT